ncbi:hypothetical protein LCGC14_0378810 [marine sediment metagenome]|uniref:Uncharacterized protein n=1 Tax=marine sediment metagenome TaxID=412755 RepID=A0A0F9WBS4_9ZZZZ
MFRRLSKIGGPLIGAIGFITLPSDLGTWGTRLKDIAQIGIDNPLSVLAICLGVVLLGYGYWDSLRLKVLGSKRWRSDKEMGDELHGWLRQAHFQLQDQPTPNSDFVFVATEPMANRPVTIAKLSNEPGVRLQGRVILSDEQKTLFQAMLANEQHIVLSDVAIELARLDIGFDGRDLVNEGFSVIAGFIPSETMTQSQFLQRVGAVSRAILMVQASLNRYLLTPDIVATMQAQLPPDLTANQ